MAIQNGSVAVVRLRSQRYVFVTPSTTVEEMEEVFTGLAGKDQLVAHWHETYRQLREQLDDGGRATYLRAFFKSYNAGL